MTAANHALTGTLIAVLIREPVVALPLAFFSHFVCDALPHFDSHFEFGKRSMYVYLFFDGLAVICILAGLLIGVGLPSPLLVVACAAFAMAPDLMWLYYGVTDKLNRYTTYGSFATFHHKIQWSASKLGIIPELFWASGAISLIVYLK